MKYSIHTLVIFAAASFSLTHIAIAQGPPVDVDALFGDTGPAEDPAEVPAEVQPEAIDPATEATEPESAPEDIFGDPVPPVPAEPAVDPIVPDPVTPPPMVDPLTEPTESMPPIVPKDPATESESPSDQPPPVVQPKEFMAPSIEKSKAMRDDFTNLYDTGRIISFSGPVLGGRFIDMEGDLTAVMLRVQAGGQMVDVFLGPGAYLNNYDVSPGIANTIYVSGTLVDMEIVDRDQYVGRSLMVADTIRFRGTTLKLRHRDGWPIWRPRPVGEKSLTDN